jgi:hypothetical protein
MFELRRPLLVAALLVTVPRGARAQEQEIDEATRGGDAKAEATHADEEDARAAEDAEAERVAKGVKLTFRLGVRFLSTSPFSKVYQNVLSAYGYGSMSALVEGAADAALSPFRWLDLGVHTGYGFGSAGTSGGSGGLLTLHSAELGGFAYGIFGRSDRRLPGTLGAGVEGGTELPFLVLRGQWTNAVLPYVAPVVLARLRVSSGVQTAIHVRYLIANWGDGFGKVGLPLGGFSVSVGANLSL